MRIGAVIVTYRSGVTIADCVSGLLRDPDVTIAVVDNSSEALCRSACETIATANPGRVTYVDPQANLGYAKAANRGVGTLGSLDYVAIVNPDTLVTRSLSELVSRAQSTPYTLVAARLDSGQDGHANARPRLTLWRELLKALAGSRAYRNPRRLRSPDGRLHKVGQLDGAFLMCSARTWESLGGFDERYELYYEDVDLCRRASSLSGSLLLNESWGIHRGGESFGRSGGTAFVALRVSRVRYLRRWYGQALGFSMAALIAALEFASRSLTAQGEGGQTRRLALVMQTQECLAPGSVQVLECQIGGKA